MNKNMFDEPPWVRHAILWHLYPLGFVGAFPPVPDRPVASPDEHRLLRIISWLDHAIALGASGILLGPIFASTSHGYDTTDYFVIDPRLGDLNDFDTLIAEAHRRGLKVVLDGVFNHVGSQFPRFQKAIAETIDGGDASANEAASWFKLQPANDRQFECFEGHPGLIALNHDNPEVAEFTTEVMTFWLDRGADGWRLDAAYAIPTSFLKTVLSEVRQQFPQAWFSGEVIHGDYAAIVEESTLDSATQYELWKAIWSSLNDKNLYELDWTLKRHNVFLESFAPTTFVGNHDVTRIASQLNDIRHLAHAIVILFTVGGVPTIFAGDEIGLTGIKTERLGGDDAIRPEFEADGPGLAGDYQARIFRLHQDLIGVRRNNPWLHQAHTETLEVSNTHLVYRCFAGDQAITVALNVGDEPITIQLPHPENTPLLPVGGTLAGTPAGPEANQAHIIDAHSWQIFGAA